MENIFNSNENKSFIWNIIYEQDGFTNIPESRLDNIKNLLDTKVTNIINNPQLINKPTLELNKILLKEFHEDLQIYKINQDRTSTLMREEKVNDFNNKLENYKTDMNSLLNIKYPEKPNFEDNLDIPIINLNNSYDSFLKQREVEINIEQLPTQNTTLQSSESFKQQLQEQIPQQVIQETTQQNNTNKPKVSFLELTTEIDNNLLNKPLEKIKKKVNESNDDNKFNIHNKLNLILNKINSLDEKYNAIHEQYINIYNILQNIKID